MIWLAALVKIVPWVVGGLVTYFASKNVIEKWGSTPKNEAAKLGIPEDKLFDYYQRKSENDSQFRKELKEEISKDFEDIREQNKKLEEQNTQLVKQLEGVTDPTEKAKILATIEANKKEMANNNKRIDSRFSQIMGTVNNLSQPSKDELGKPEIVERKFQAEVNKPNLTNWKNWGIIAFVVIIAIMLVSFLKKMLTKLTESMN